MAVLDQLTFSNVAPKRDTSPAGRFRRWMIEAIDVQLAMVEAEAKVPELRLTRRRWIKNEAGKKELLEVPRPCSPSPGCADVPVVVLSTRDVSAYERTEPGLVSKAGDTVMVGGGARFIESEASFVLEALPAFLQADRAAPGAAVVARVLTLLGAEVGDGRPGSVFIVERVAEILLVEVIRAHVETGAAKGAGWTRHQQRLSVEGAGQPLLTEQQVGGANLHRHGDRAYQVDFAVGPQPARRAVNRRPRSEAASPRRGAARLAPRRGCGRGPAPTVAGGRRRSKARNPRRDRHGRRRFRSPVWVRSVPS